MEPNFAGGDEKFGHAISIIHEGQSTQEGHNMMRNRSIPITQSSGQARNANIRPPRRQIRKMDIKNSVDPSMKKTTTHPQSVVIFTIARLISRYSAYTFFYSFYGLVIPRIPSGCTPRSYYTCFPSLPPWALTYLADLVLMLCWYYAVVCSVYSKMI